jgi:hypothetical protein
MLIVDELRIACSLSFPMIVGACTFAGIGALVEGPSVAWLILPVDVLLNWLLWRHVTRILAHDSHERWYGVRRDLWLYIQALAYFGSIAGCACAVFWS